MFQHNFLVPFFFHNAKRQRHSWFVTKQTEGFSSGAKRQARHRDLNNKVTSFESSSAPIPGSLCPFFTRYSKPCDVLGITERQMDKPS